MFEKGSQHPLSQSQSQFVTRLTDSLGGPAVYCTLSSVTVTGAVRTHVDTEVYRRPAAGELPRNPAVRRAAAPIKRLCRAQ